MRILLDFGHFGDPGLPKCPKHYPPKCPKTYNIYYYSHEFLFKFGGAEKHRLFGYKNKASDEVTSSIPKYSDNSRPMRSEHLNKHAMLAPHWPRII